MKILNVTRALTVLTATLLFSLAAVAQQPPPTGTFPSNNATQTPYLIAENGIPILLVEDEGVRNSYEYAVQAFAPVATPTAFFVIQGSATKVLRIKKIRVNGVATATGNMQFQVARWSTAGTPGSAVLTALTPAKHDASDGAATAVVSTVGTANYTTQGTGSTVPMFAERACFGTVGTALTCPLELSFSTRSDKPLTVRGTSDYIVFSGNGSAVPAGGVMDITVETEEDTN